MTAVIHNLYPPNRNKLKTLKEPEQSSQWMLNTVIQPSAAQEVDPENGLMNLIANSSSIFVSTEIV